MAETDSRVLEFLEEGLFLYGVGKVQEAIQRWRKVLELDPRNERALDYIESAGGDVSQWRKNAAAAQPAAPSKPAAPVFTPPAMSPIPVPEPIRPVAAPTPPPMAAQPPPMAAMPWAPAPAPAPAAVPAPFSGFNATPTAPTPMPTQPAPPTPQAAAPPMNGVARPAAPTAETRDDLLRKAAALFRAQQHEMALELLERIGREFPPVDDTLRGYLDATRAAVLSGLRGQWGQMDKVPRPKMNPGQIMQMHLSPEQGFLLSRIDGMSSLEDILSISGIEEMTALRALQVLVQKGVIELT